MNDVADECDDTKQILFQPNLDLRKMERSDYCTMDCVLSKMDVVSRRLKFEKILNSQA